METKVDMKSMKGILFKSIRFFFFSKEKHILFLHQQRFIRHCSGFSSVYICVFVPYFATHNDHNVVAVFSEKLMNV